MLTFPNAKINLGLQVVEKRLDGYHNIETVFYPIGLKDALEVISTKDGNFSFQSGGIPIDGKMEDNLVVKAYLLLKKEFNLPPVSIYLQKTIPFGAGLGGGSSDAAFMLKMLNEKFELGLESSSLASYAKYIGADCPFFLTNTPSYATGIGDIINPINFTLKGYHLVLVKPNIHVSTSKAYGRITPSHPKKSVKEIISYPIENWKHLLKNDFEEGVFAHFPLIGEIKEKLYQSGAVYASMSGSGSSVFGIFNEKIDLKQLFTDCFVLAEEFL